MTPTPDLGGFTVGVTADRHRAEQAAMLTRFGIDVVSGPCLATTPAKDDRELRAVTEALIARPPDVLVANTGVGIRSWLAIAATLGLDEPLVAALGRARVVARGPKAASAAQIVDLPVSWMAPDEQMATVARYLAGQDLRGVRIAVQLDGRADHELAAELRAQGAEVLEIRVYRWTLPTDTRPAERLIDLCCGRGLDVVTFTAAPAITNLVGLAREQGRERDLVAAFNDGVLAACVGPVCAAEARRVGIVRVAVPDHWRLGPLVRAVVEHLDGQRRRYQVDGHDMVIQGAAVVVDGLPVRLTDRERAVLDRLVARAGGTVSRSTLLGEVWLDRRVDAHVLETVVARLRAKLGEAGGAVETAVRRGYRFAGVDRTTERAVPAPARLSRRTPA